MTNQMAKYVPNDFEGLQKWASYIAQSDFSPLNKEADVVTAVLTGQSLGLDPMTSLTKIYPINNRATLDYKIRTALAKKQGVSFKILEDYVPVQVFKNKEGATFSYEEVMEAYPDKFDIIGKNVSKDYVIPEGKVAVIRVILTYRTTIEFYQKVIINGKIQLDTLGTHSLNLSDIQKLFPDKFTSDSSNWVKQPKNMLFVRTLTQGYDRYCPEASMGMDDTHTMADVENLEVDLDESEVQQIQDIESEVVETKVDDKKSKK